MSTTQKSQSQLEALAAHLAARREAVLQAWHQAVEADSEQTTAAALSRTQFNDHIPAVLDDLAARLRARPGAERAAAAAETKDDATRHGLHRWQQGYHLREVSREWGHLHLCLVDELEAYAAAHPGLEAGVMPTARRELARLVSSGVSESTAQYFLLQQTEAAGHVRALERALAEVQELERRRAEAWREAAHDLRGNLGVVKNVTTGLTQEGVPEAMREQFLRLLQQSVQALHSLLDDVMSLARLQAGHERRDVKPLDAAALLGKLCASLQPLAAERGLTLRVDGPAELPVEGDAVKVQRIVQNLLLNALKYTARGSVTVSWGDSRANDPGRWMVCVADTGPGLPGGAGVPMADALQAATQQSHEVEEDAGACTEAAGTGQGVRPPHLCSAHAGPGEGIGLAIVKRLCELLDASLELDSETDKGTTVRVIFPRRYGTSANPGRES